MHFGSHFNLNSDTATLAAPVVCSLPLYECGKRDKDFDIRLTSHLDVKITCVMSERQKLRVIC